MSSDSAGKNNGRKKLYKCEFNWHGEMFTLHKRAHTPLQAWRLCCAEIAMKTQRNSWFVRQYFDGTKDNYTINEVVGIVLDKHA